MDWLITIALILTGLTFVMLEIFILPGFIAGIIGASIVIFGIIRAYISHGAIAGHIALASTFVVFILLMVLVFRTGVLKKISLSDVIDGKANTMDVLDVKIGDEGKTISRLTTIGKAIINDKYYEVKTNGDFIEENKEIIIFKIFENQIYVKLKN